MVNPFKAGVPSGPAVSPSSATLSQGGFRAIDMQQVIANKAAAKKKTIPDGQGLRGIADRPLNSIYDHPTSPGNKATSSFFAKY